MRTARIAPLVRRLRCAAAAALLAGLAACGPTPPPGFEKAASQVTDDLLSQTQKLPGFIAKIERAITSTPAPPTHAIVIDPMLDTKTGEQTTATTLLEQRVVGRIKARFEGFEMLPFQAANLSRSKYLLTGTLTRVPTQKTRKVLRIDLALTELRSGSVIAQATTLASEDQLDHTPLPYYKDSPVLMKDKVIEGYVRSTVTPAGQKADPYYLVRIAAASQIQEATSLYNAERYQEALGQYRNALTKPHGEQLRTLSGIYLSNVRLGRMADAEKAFAQVVALGFAYNELGVKLLFNPGSTEFWSDPKISGTYAMWLRQIARESMAANVCLNIVGHTSSSGPAASNDALSLRRATYVRQRLTGELAALGPRTRATGAGFSENIVGSGTDNAIDVLDRRVEFKIIPCS